MTTEQNENPYQSPAATVCVAPAHPHAENEFLVGVTLGFAFAVFLFLFHPLVGFLATIGAAIVVMRAWLELSRKQIAGWKIVRWEATRILFASLGRIAIAAATGFGMSGIASSAGAALFKALPALNGRFSSTEAILADGALGLLTSLALFYFLGPASVDTLRQQQQAHPSPVPSDQGTKSSERT